MKSIFTIVCVLFQSYNLILIIIKGIFETKIIFTNIKFEKNLISIF